MNWEETVIPTHNHSCSVSCPHCEDEFGIEGEIVMAHEIQAKVSFEKGQQDERERIVNLLAAYGRLPCDATGIIPFDIPQSVWASLKEKP